MSSKFKLPKDGGLVAGTTPSDILERYEKIHTSVFDTEHEGVTHLANKIVQQINNHNYEYDAIIEEAENPFVLGLSTGRTPVGLYRELVRRFDLGEVSFENVVLHSLDELFPIKSTEQQSRNFRIHEDFLSHVNIKPYNIHIFDGCTPQDKVSEYCKDYENKIKKIDLMILGMGLQGQVGFNEPGSHYKSRTRLVQLNHATRESLMPIFNDFETIPKMAITMGIGTVLRADKILLLAWGEDKAAIVQKVVEGVVCNQIPASYLQAHPNIELVIDVNAAQQLTREQTPWLVGPCEWTNKFIRKAVVWLCGVVEKPILKLTYQDYIDNSLSPLLESAGSYDDINIRVFNDLQHTITGWPGGKPNADDSTRPVPAQPFPKRVIIFSPYPDDDVISMGGTFLRLVQQGHDVNVAYQTSGSLGVNDDVVIQMIDTSREFGVSDNLEEIKALIKNKIKGQSEPAQLQSMKAAIRRAEARAACRLFGLNEETNAHFLELPFYEKGGIKGVMTQEDIDITVSLLRKIKPHQIYAAGDFSDPHGTHRVCIETLLCALNEVKNEPWIGDCQVWLYRGAWQEWSVGMVDMAVPLSPAEMLKKRQAIYRHLSQKDIMPFPGNETREYWQRVEARTQNTAMLYDKLGMAEYQAIEVFVKVK